MALPAWEPDTREALASLGYSKKAIDQLVKRAESAGVDFPSAAEAVQWLHEKRRSKLSSIQGKIESSVRKPAEPPAAGEEPTPETEATAASARRDEAVPVLKKIQSSLEKMGPKQQPTAYQFQKPESPVLSSEKMSSVKEKLEKTTEKAPIPLMEKAKDDEQLKKRVDQEKKDLELKIRMYRLEKLQERMIKEGKPIPLAAAYPSVKGKMEAAAKPAEKEPEKKAEAAPAAAMEREKLDGVEETLRRILEALQAGLPGKEQALKLRPLEEEGKAKSLAEDYAKQFAEADKKDKKKPSGPSLSDQAEMNAIKARLEKMLAGGFAGGLPFRTHEVRKTDEGVAKELAKDSLNLKELQSLERDTIGVRRSESERFMGHGKNVAGAVGGLITGEGGVQNLIGSLGSMASMLGPKGAVVGGFLSVGAILMSVLDKIANMGKRVHEQSMGFAQFSGSMAQVEVESEARQIRLGFERGERRSASAREYAAERDATRRAQARLQDEIDNMRAEAATLQERMQGNMARMMNRALFPDEAAADDELEAGLHHENSLMQFALHVADHDWMGAYGMPSRFTHGPGGGAEGHVE